MRTVTGLLRDRESAERVYGLIAARGYSPDDVNILMSEEVRRQQFFEGGETEFGNRALEDADRGAAIGGTIGSTLAAIAAIGSSVALPGLGLVIAGPIAAALAGAGAGAATGGLIGALIGAGIPEEYAKDYDEGIRNGGIVMSVNARNDEDAAYFNYALKEYQAERVYGGGGGGSGWRGISADSVTDQPTGRAVEGDAVNMVERGSNMGQEVTMKTPGEKTEVSTSAPDHQDKEGRPASGLTDQEDDESASLYVNLWIDDEDRILLEEPIRLTAGLTYYFHIAIDRSPIPGASRPFDEPEKFREMGKATLVVEVICPFLNENGRLGYARREVDYYAGYGFDAQTFLLEPTATEKYYLTVRVLFNRETLYREIFAIEVIDAHAANLGLKAEEAAINSDKSA